MTAPDTLLIFGGWEGHQPAQAAERFGAALEARGHRVECVSDIAILDDAERLRRADLIFPIWTMGRLSGPQVMNLLAAVREGSGLGGFHGGMGDAFRGHPGYAWMCGGQFAGHPHVGSYTVEVVQPEHEIVAGLDRSFDYESEQYYMLVDPGIDVLATSPYTYEGRTVTMPVVWTKMWGRGRVFYSALGHVMAEFDRFPKVFEMTLR